LSEAGSPWRPRSQTTQKRKSSRVFCDIIGFLGADQLFLAARPPVSALLFFHVFSVFWGHFLSPFGGLRSKTRDDSFLAIG